MVAKKGRVALPALPLNPPLLSVNFEKILRTSSDRAHPDDCICEFWEVFQVTSFIGQLWETAYFMYKLQDFNNQIQIQKVFHYTRTRSSYSKAFIYLKSLKITCEEVITCDEVVNLQVHKKKLFHAYFVMHFAFIFSEYITITSSE